LFSQPPKRAEPSETTWTSSGTNIVEPPKTTVASILAPSLCNFVFLKSISEPPKSTKIFAPSKDFETTFFSEPENIEFIETKSSDDLSAVDFTEPLKSIKKPKVMRRIGKKRFQILTSKSVFTKKNKPIAEIIKPAEFLPLNHIEEPMTTRINGHKSENRYVKEKPKILSSPNWEKSKLKPITTIIKPMRSFV